MADVKIRVIADASNAIKNIQDITDGGLSADKSLTSLSNALAKLETRQRKGENVSAEYSKQLKQIQDQGLRAANAALAAGKGYEGAAKLIEKYRYALFKAGATSAAATFDVPLREFTKTAGSLQAEQIAEKAKKQRDYADALEKAQIAQRKFNEDVERGMVLAKNDPAEKLQYEYRQLEKQLRANVEAQVELENSGGKWSTAMVKQKAEATVLASRMKELQKEMSKVSRTPINERMSNLVKSFVSAQAVVWAVRRAFTFFTSTLKDAAKVAALAEETYNLFITTFEQVGDTAQRTAYKLGHALGIATSSAQKALGVFGDLMKGYGATDAEALKFAETAARTTLDIVSFKNIAGSTDEVMQSFASGLAGNVENFRKLGYVVTQAEVKALLAKKGLDGLTGSALQQAMVQARLEIVMKKAVNAMGDMEKTLESTVNVERRLNEAWLEYKENLGQDVNAVMAPLKRWWLDILETTNKANEAKNRFVKGLPTGGLYDLNKNADMRLFQQNISSGTWAPWHPNASAKDLETNIINAMRLFDADFNDVKRALTSMGWMRVLEKDFPNVVKALEREGELRERERTDTQNYERRYSALSSKAQGTQGLLDELASLIGVTLKGDVSQILLNISAYAKTSSTAGEATGEMNRIMAEAFADALSDISTSEWSKFVSPTDLALGKASEQQGLEGKAGELERLYGMLYNYSMKDGELSEEEEENLKNVLKERQKVLDQMDDIVKAEQERKKAEADLAKLEENKIQRMTDSIGSTQKFIDSLNALNGGGTSANASQFLALRNFGGMTESGLRTLASNAIDQVIRGMANADWSDFVSPIEKAMENVTEEGSLEAALTELKNFYALSYNWAIQDGELNEKEAKQLSDIVAIRQKVLDQMTEMEKAERAKLERQEFTDFATGMFGDIIPIVDGFKSAIGSFSGGDWATSFFSPLTTMTKLAMDSTLSMNSFLGTLIKLASQLEIVQRVSNIFAETILPVLNQLFAPLMPVLDTLVDIVKEYLADYLEPFYTLIKALAPLLNTILELARPLLQIMNALRPIIDVIIKGIALIVGIINGSIKFIADSLKWLAGWIMKGVYAVVNGVISVLNAIPFVSIDKVDTSQVDAWASKNPIDSFKEGFNEVQDAINKGNGLLDDIKGNTDQTQDEKLKYLAELYKGGLLSADQYYAQRSSLTGENWDRTKLFSGGSYYNGAGYTVARYGDVTINIDGTNLSAEQVAEAIEKQLRPGAKGFQIAY